MASVQDMYSTYNISQAMAAASQQAKDRAAAYANAAPKPPKTTNTGGVVAQTSSATPKVPTNVSIPTNIPTNISQSAAKASTQAKDRAATYAAKADTVSRNIAAASQKAKDRAATYAANASSANSLNPSLTPTIPPTAAGEALPSQQAATQTPAATIRTPTTLSARVATTNKSESKTGTPAAPDATTKTTTKSGSEKTSSKTETETRSTPVEYTPTGMYDPANLQAYNDQRVADIRSLYDAALQNSLSGMRTAYDQNMSDATAARDLISPQYQRSMNALSAEYERQRRNNNMQAAANGLNTGAGSQMALAQSANYQANQAGLAAKENEALNEANRRIGDLQRNYQNAIAEATANNNYKLAAAMMEEYQNAYKRQMEIENTNYQRAQQAEQQNYTRSWNEDERAYSRGVDEAAKKAQYGDFSGYKQLYGEEVGNLMELTWALQNPNVAWAAGKLSAEDYQALTGKVPNGSTATGLGGASGGTYGSGGGYYSGGSSNKSGNSLASIMANSPYADVYSAAQANASKKSQNSVAAALGADATARQYFNNAPSYYQYYSNRGGGGYSASRDKAYRGAPGYLTEDGRFLTGFDSDSGIPHSQEDYDRAQTFANVYSQTGSLRDANIAAYQGGGENSGGTGGGDTVDNTPTQTWSEKAADALSNVPIAGKLFK